MKPTKILNDFSRLTDAELESKAGVILANLTGNDAFASLSPAIHELSKAIKKFKEARQIFMGYESFIKAEKLQSRKQLLAALKQAGQHVVKAADGDEAKLASSGYLVSETQ